MERARRPARGRPGRRPRARVRQCGDPRRDLAGRAPPGGRSPGSSQAALFAALSRRSTDVAIVIDSHGEITYVSPSASDVFGPCRAADLNWAAPYTGARASACPSYPAASAPVDASALLRTLTTYSGRYLSPGSKGPVVSAVQQAVGAPVDGIF